jgi:hypothetical protein
MKRWGKSAAWRFVQRCKDHSQSFARLSTPKKSLSSTKTTAISALPTLNFSTPVRLLSELRATRRRLDLNFNGVGTEETRENKFFESVSGLQEARGLGTKKNLLSTICLFLSCFNFFFFVFISPSSGFHTRPY